MVINSVLELDESFVKGGGGGSFQCIISLMLLLILVFVSEDILL